MTLELKVTIGGKTTDDLESALQEVMRLISEGYTSGFNGNDTGRFVFDISEEDVQEETGR